MRLLYTRVRRFISSLKNTFIRQFRVMTQDEVSDKLGLTGECKRRTMIRYKKRDRNPKDDRAMEISKILNASFNVIKKYDLK